MAYFLFFSHDYDFSNERPTAVADSVGLLPDSEIIIYSA